MARARLQRVVQDPEGDVVPNRDVTVLTDAGAPFGAPIYDAAVGGSVVTQPATDPYGMLELYADQPVRVQLEVDGVITPYNSDFFPDPGVLIYQQMTAPASLTGLSSPTDWTLTLRNQDPSGRALRVRKYDDSGDLLTVSSAGVVAPGLLSLTSTAIQAGNVPVKLDAYSTPGDYALTVQHDAAGGSGNKAFIVRQHDGQTAFEVGSHGSGPNAALMGTWVNPAVGPFVVSNVRNWDSNADFFLGISMLTGSPRGSHQAAVCTYQSCAQPTDGFGGTVGIPDHVVMNFDYFAQNIASGASQNHDGSGRAIELQTMVFADTGQRTMGCATIGTHTAVSKITAADVALVGGVATTEYGDCGVIFHNQDQGGPMGYPGFGTTIRSNTAILIVGDPGWKQAIAYFGAARAGEGFLYAVDSHGDVYSGNVYPRPGGAYTLGAANRRWGNAFISTLIAENGGAANPTIALIGGGASSDGLFGFSGAGLVGVSVLGTERGRFDGAGLGVTGGQRFTGTAVISPSQIVGPGTANDYSPSGLGTARIIRLSVTGAVSISGIAAQLPGCVLTILNLGPGTLTLTHEDTGSAAVNRFNLKGNRVLGIHDAVEVWYDTYSGAPNARWKQMGA